MALQVFAGETVRITARDLTHADDGPVTSGATVTHAIYDNAGALVDSVTATASGDDWYGDLAAPDTAGLYTVKSTATKSGATWKGRTELEVETF
jgi:hypothetical protein